jgi:hypothetical protein
MNAVMRLRVLVPQGWLVSNKPTFRNGTCLCPGSDFV